MYQYNVPLRACSLLWLVAVWSTYSTKHLLPSVASPKRLLYSTVHKHIVRYARMAAVPSAAESPTGGGVGGGLLLETAPAAGDKSFEIALRKPSTAGPLGIKLDDNNIVTKIQPGSLVAQDKRMRVGDQILSVNGMSLGGEQNFADALKQLEHAEVYRFRVLHTIHSNSYGEKVKALILQEKARQQDKLLEAEQMKAAKKQAVDEARGMATVRAAAHAAKALRGILSAETYKMPELEKVLDRLQELERSQPTTTKSKSAKGGRPKATKEDAQPHNVSPSSATVTDEVEAELLPVAETPIFVHFIPPPLRQPGKADLPWIVHTCDGSGCREAKHVSFHSMTGFSTFEGQPPEQIEGVACKCTIANHHLRGYGTVRWQGEVHAALGGPCCAIVEDSGSAASIDQRHYMQKAKKLQAQVKELERSLHEVQAKHLSKKVFHRYQTSVEVCPPGSEDVSC